MRFSAPAAVAMYTAAVALHCVVAIPVATAQPTGIDPQATQILKASTSYLAGLKRLSVDSRSELEVVLKSGQRIEFLHTARLKAERPNKFRAERFGDLAAQNFIYDGKSLTLFNPVEGVFATLPAPGTIEGALDLARTKLDIVAPAGDLLYANAYDILMTDVTSGFVVGKSMVDGVLCTHLAFRAPHVDWQIWIQDGKQPLPRRLVIHSTDVAGGPAFSVSLSKWNVAPTFDASTFRFTPPKGARGVEFITAGSATR